jgi:hypothetical protein
VPSIVKAHFSWTWQCTTLNWGDEVVNLLMCCLQPYQLFIPDYTTMDRRRSGMGRFVFEVLSMYHETKVAKPGVRWMTAPVNVVANSVLRKQEPDYNFVLPNHDPLHCPVGALAILLHYMFDQENLVSHVDGWDWSHASTWRKVCLGLSASHAITDRCIDRSNLCLVSKLVAHAVSQKKLHLARHTIPSVMENMGQVSHSFPFTLSLTGGTGSAWMQLMQLDIG